MSRFKVAAVLVIGCFSAFAQQEPSSGWRRFGNGTAPEEAAVPQGGGNPAPVTRGGALPSELVIPAGTFITVRVDEPLSSDHNKAGDNFSATLSQPIVANGFVVARRGQTLGGRVAEAQKAGRVNGQSRLGVELIELGLVDGQQMPVRTQLMEYSGGTSKGRDAAAIGATTGVGAAIGGAAAGGVGAGAGAAAGAVASTIGVLLTRGRSTEIYPESMLTFRTVEPITIFTDRSAQAFQPVQQGDYPAQAQARPRVAAGPRYGGVYAPYPYPYPYYGPYYGYGPRVSIYYGGRIGGGRRRW